MVGIRRAVLSTGFLGSAHRSVRKAAGALSYAILAPAYQPLALGPTHGGLAHLCLRCPSMLARRDTRIEASRVRRLSPLQAVEDQSRAWGIRCHSCTWREGLTPSWRTELQSLWLCDLPENRSPLSINGSHLRWWGIPPTREGSRSAATFLPAISQVIRDPVPAQPSAPMRLPTEEGRASPMSDGPRSSSSHPLSRR
jgi:hypothetical protein